MLAPNALAGLHERNRSDMNSPAMPMNAFGTQLERDEERSSRHGDRTATGLNSQDVMALKDAVRLLGQECLRPRGLPGNPRFSDLAGLNEFLDDVFVEGRIDHSVEITGERLERVSTGLSQAFAQTGSIAVEDPYRRLEALLESLHATRADVESNGDSQPALVLSGSLIAVIENVLSNESALAALE